MKRRTLTVAAAFALGAATLACAQAQARLVTGIDWLGRGVWLKAEFHTHSRFTDGAHTVNEIVAAAVTHGCDVVAITDHADGDLKGATPEYVDAIQKARAQNPNLVVMTALEWNVPPGKGLEHATVLFPSQMESLDTLAPFKERFDDQTKEGENPELAVQGFAALTPADRNALAPVVFLNHPSRRPNSTSAPTITFAALKKGAPSILIGFEGAPGHQRGTPLGSYPAGVTLKDRWDPIAAEVGGRWDQWLREGLSAWGAIANADFHQEAGDFWPCEFASTWVYAPERSVDGVIRAMRAGSFFAEHGHIAQEVDLEARFDGQPRGFHAGETVAVAAGAKATVSLRMKVPAVDYLGRANQIDTVELIGVSSSKTETLVSGPPGAGDAINTTVTVPVGGIVLRARGRRALEGGEGLMFYTNPIRIAAGAP